MEESIILEKLSGFGLTRQEASLYLYLLQTTGATGYEAAKQTGISRSNAYSGLAALTEKGAAYRVEGNTSRYVAVDVKEFCRNKLYNLRQDSLYLEKHMPAPVREEEGYFTITGERNLLDKARFLIENAKERLYLSAANRFFKQFQPELEKFAADGKKLVILTEKNPGIPGAVFYHKEFSEESSGQIRLIADSSRVLTGEITGQISDSGLYCGLQNFVDVFKEAMRNEIRLIELTEKNGE